MWIGILFVSRTFKTPIWANPFEAPAPRTRAIVAGFFVGTVISFVGAHEITEKTRMKSARLILIDLF
jgi:hypothetical protein